jgi:SAM-dependent methyltransferase
MDLKNYWDLQPYESKKWQENRYKRFGFVWGDEPGPTAKMAAQLFEEKGCKNILVVGCGYGRECVYFYEKGFKVTGIDLSEEGIKLAKHWSQEKKLNIDFYVDSVLDMKHPNDGYDAVFSHKVFHQFRYKDRKKMIEECHQVLKDNGILFLSDLSVHDAEFGIGVEIERNMFERPHRPYRPIYFLSKDHLDEFDVFDIEEVKPFSYLESHPGESTEHEHHLLIIVGRKNI